MIEERRNGYQDLYQAGWNAAMDDKAAPQAQQPAVEPYAWMAVGGTIWRHKGSDDDVPLFTAPPPPADVPLLTDEEIVAAIASAKKIPAAYAGWVRDQRIEYGRSIEQAVRQKVGLK